MVHMTRLEPLRRLAGQAGRTLLDMLYPLECAGCGGSGAVICDRCAEDLPWLVPPFCRVCANPGEPDVCAVCVQTIRQFDGVRAPFRYKGCVREAILALKYGGIKAAAPQLGDLLADHLETNPLPGDIVIPVPMHGSRRKERGYNQAALLAGRVAQRLDLSYRDDTLMRTRRVDPQAGMASAMDRMVNVADSVTVTSHGGVKGASILLVDDVATTGSTLDACASALKESGAATVWCLTLAVAGSRNRKE